MTSQDFFLESPRCHRPWSSPCWFCQKSCLTSNSPVQGWGFRSQSGPLCCQEGLLLRNAHPGHERRQEVGMERPVALCLNEEKLLRTAPSLYPKPVIPHP